MKDLEVVRKKGKKVGDQEVERKESKDQEVEKKKGRKVEY